MLFKTDAENTAFELGRRASAAAPARPMPVFRKNANGQPEYATIQIVMDHLMENDTGHVNTKLTLSTEEPEAALRSLWDYYGETANLISLESTLDLLVQHRMAPQGVFLYVVPADMGDRFGNLRLEVVMSTDLFAALSKHPNFGNGSEFVLVETLKEQFAKIMSDIRKAKGGFPPLSYIGLDGQLAFAPAAKEAVTEEA